MSRERDPRAWWLDDDPFDKKRHNENRNNSKPDFEQQNQNTEISFIINFEIENKFLNIIMTKSFQYGLNKIADAFQDRANKLFKNS